MPCSMWGLLLMSTFPPHPDDHSTNGSAYEYHNETLNDRWIVEQVFPGLRGGYFVEIGAANGRAASSCYVLETALDWTGICIEPHDDFYGELVLNRPRSVCVSVCLSDRSETVDFVMAEGVEGLAYCSGVQDNLTQKWGSDEILQTGRVVQKQAVPLADVLRNHAAPRVIDYLAIDIEGSEYKVLRDFPFEEYVFRAMTIETDEWVWEKLMPILNHHGYQQVSSPFNTDRLFEKYCLHRSVLTGLG